MIDNEYNKIWLENNIIFAEYKAGARVNLNIAKKVVNDRLLLCQGKSYPLVGDIRNLVKIDNDAREYLGTDEACVGIDRLAVLTGNPIQALLGNFYLKFKKSRIPTRLFTKKRDAINWINNNRFLN